MKLLDKIKEFKEKNNIEIEVEQIQNITYQSKLVDKDPFYVRDGQGYRATILVYDIPLDVPLQWITVFSTPDTYVTIDIAPLEFDKVKRGLKKSVQEQQSRMKADKDEFMQIEAGQNLSDVTDLIADLTRGQEKVLALTIRLYIYAHTLEKLEQKTEKVLKELKQQEYEGAVYPDEQMIEEKAKHRSYQPSTQANYQIPLTTETLSAGYFYRYFDLQDPTGIYWGKNEIGANVYFDMFENDGRKRIFYNLLLIGLMGSGKSATVGKLILQNATAGNRIRVLDVTGEHRKLIESVNGKILKVDGKSVSINPHSIKLLEKKERYTGEDLEAILIKTVNSAMFSLQTFSPILNEFHINIYGQIVYRLYERKGALQHLLSIEEEVIYSDVLHEVLKVIKAIEHDVTKTKEIGYLQELSIILTSLSSGVYANYFNKRSTFNYWDEQIIGFDVRHITNDKKIFIPIALNLINMFWNELIYFGTEEKEKYENGVITHAQAKKYVTIYEEAHYYLNAKQVEVLDTMIEFSREARKYFGGEVIVAHLIKDFIPKNASSEGLEKVQKLFELMQYKIIMKQDNNTKNEIKNIFGEELKDYHIRNVNNFVKGESILNILGHSTQKMYIHLSPLEKKYLKGGK